MSIFSSLNSFFKEEETETLKPLSNEEAVAGLMLEAATLDQDYAESERESLLTCLGDAFGMDSKECHDLLNVVEENTRTKAGVHKLVTHLNKQLDQDQRFTVLVQIWKVVLADGRIDAVEKQYMRRLAALLHISDRDSGLARQEATSIH